MIDQVVDLLGPNVPNFGGSEHDQQNYQREHAMARRSQTCRWMTAPRCPLLTPLGRIVPPNAPVEINDFVGDETREPAALLYDAILEGRVLEADAYKNLPIPAPTLQVDRHYVRPVEDPSALVPTFGGEHDAEAYAAECRAAERASPYEYVVAPKCRLALVDGEYLEAGNAVTIEHFRNSTKWGSARAQLRDFVDARVVLRGDNA